MMTERLATTRTHLCSEAEMDISKTFECGQCFRWNRDKNGAYSGVAFGRAATVWTEAGEIYIDAPEGELGFWAQYFDLSTDYDAARCSIGGGEYLSVCVEHGTGIRILRQEPWEALCSFIISQCNNIPRIKRIIEKLCAMFGDPIAYGGRTLYAFPKAERIAALATDALAPINSGYRAPYIIAAAREVAEGKIDLDAVAAMPCDAARAELKKISGVGDKIANCVLLFGLHRMDVFPVDVWIRRVLDEHFDSGFEPCSLGPYAGLAQQYMFYYARCIGKSPL